MATQARLPATHLLEILGKAGYSTLREFLSGIASEPLAILRSKNIKALDFDIGLDIGASHLCGECVRLPQFTSFDLANIDPQHHFLKLSLRSSASHRWMITQADRDDFGITIMSVPELPLPSTLDTSETASSFRVYLLPFSAEAGIKIPNMHFMSTRQNSVEIVLPFTFTLHGWTPG